MKTESTSQCIVTPEDYRIRWRGEEAPDYQKPRYTGKERRKNVHDRRWFNNGGGRRRFDRKS